MRFLYTIGIYCYTFGIRVVALFGHTKARQMVQGWKQWPDQVARLDGTRPTVWFHAASLGEFEQARPVLEAYRIRHPEHQVLLTFFSPSGYEVRKNYPLADVVCYLPPDTARVARRMVEAVKPTKVYFVKYEFWYNYLGQLHRAQVPTFIFSAIFRSQQYFFGRFGGWFLKQLRECFTHLFVQDEASKQLLAEHGITQVSVAGDTRFDRVQQVVDSPEGDELVERWLAATEPCPVVVAGSSWEPDEELLLRYLNEHDGQVRIVLAPHVISETHLRYIEREAERGRWSSVRYSRLKAGEVIQPDNRVIIIDNMGLLSRLYRYGRVAYIGGGFGVGIHNILEAVAYGKPVLFGPNYTKFKEARDILQMGGGASHNNYTTFEDHLQGFLDSEQQYANASWVCKQYVGRNLGSSSQILNQSEQQ